MAHDTDTAREFYKTVFGWTDSVDESGYIAFAQDGRVQAGGMAISPEMGEVPPNWSVYFLVEDMDTAVARVKELGGTVINGPFPAGTMGPMAVVSDPRVVSLILFRSMRAAWTRLRERR
ncbi:MAG: VOC family protein [Chloroflexota bacterium]